MLINRVLPILDNVGVDSVVVFTATTTKTDSHNQPGNKIDLSSPATVDAISVAIRIVVATPAVLTVVVSMVSVAAFMGSVVAGPLPTVNFNVNCSLAWTYYFVDE